MRRKPIAPRTFLAGVPLFGELDAASIDRLAAGGGEMDLALQQRAKMLCCQVRLRGIERTAAQVTRQEGGDSSE